MVEWFVLVSVVVSVSVVARQVYRSWPAISREWRVLRTLTTHPADSPEAQAILRDREEREGER